MLDTTDVAKARSFLEAQAHSAGAHSESYRGVAYQVAPDGVAEGIVHRFAVIGSEAGMKSVIDTAGGGPALAQAAAYTKLASTADAERLPTCTSARKARRAPPTPAATESILPLVKGVLGNPGQLYLSLIPSANTVALDLDTLPGLLRVRKRIELRLGRRIAVHRALRQVHQAKRAPPLDERRPGAARASRRLLAGDRRG